MARPQCDTPLVSIGSLSTSHRAERERANGKKKAARKEGRKEGRRRNNERMNKLTANYTCSSFSSGAFFFPGEISPFFDEEIGIFF
jgi:hypothetical protein